jgi:hypothetical protein
VSHRCINASNESNSIARPGRRQSARGVTNDGFAYLALAGEPGSRGNTQISQKLLREDSYSVREALEWLRAGSRNERRCGVVWCREGTIVIRKR